MSESVVSESAAIDISGLDTSELLNQLRDIQEPLAPQGTPLWIIAATLGLAMALLWLFWFQRYRKRFAFRQEALARVDAIAVRAAGATTDTVDTSSCLFDLASLLRQLMRHRLGATINTLDGKNWLTALDNEFTSRWFCDGRGQVFGSVIYQKQDISGADLAALCEELKREIRHLKPHSRKR